MTANSVGEKASADLSFNFKPSKSVRLVRYEFETLSSKKRAICHCREMVEAIPSAPKRPFTPVRPSPTVRVSPDTPMPRSCK